MELKPTSHTADDAREWTRRMFYQADDTLSGLARDQYDSADVLGRIEFPRPHGFTLTVDNRQSAGAYDRIRRRCAREGLEFLALAEVIGYTPAYAENAYAIGLRDVPDEDIPRLIPHIIAVYRSVARYGEGRRKIDAESKCAGERRSK